MEGEKKMPQSERQEMFIFFHHLPECMVHVESFHNVKNSIMLFLKTGKHDRDSV